ncbi:NRDE family protein [Hippea alviniae]|uniref:NRDE family protein n=1 Tax=Hippea alviniae TaxID=1279027 RepID=UPI0003B33C04|nr:NRDE family protein [Hippea alviniae]
MCVYAFYLNKKRDIFVMMGNRDEEFKRKSIGLHFANENTLMGIDLKEKGSWLGLTKNGKIAFITNHRNPKIFKENAPSRGHIVKKFLTENINEKEFISFLKDTKSIFNGYNLVFGNLTDKRLFYYSNIKDELVEIEDGIHCLSNAFLNSSWPKGEKLKTFLKNAIEKEIDEETILSFLEETDSDNLSSLFLNINGLYGTHFSYFIKNRNREIFILEKNHLEETKSRYIFRLTSS